MNGEFTLERPANADKLVVSFIGYNTDTISIASYQEYIDIVLNEGVQLAEVNVTGRKMGFQKLRSSVTNAELINSDELCRAACCNLGESFVTNPSVDVNYSDAATGAKQIKLLGLSGTYVQMLTENIPNFRGASAPYGLGYVPGPWMNSIQVSKGTSSVKNGYEALTGQINIEFKKPQAAEADWFSANLFASTTNRYEANADASVKMRQRRMTAMETALPISLRWNSITCSTDGHTWENTMFSRQVSSLSMRNVQADRYLTADIHISTLTA